MSVEQAQGYAQEIIGIVNKFQTDAAATSGTFETELEGLAQEFIDLGHGFATDMTVLANALVTDTKAAYDKWYPDGAPIVGDIGEPDEEPVP